MRVNVVSMQCITACSDASSTLYWVLPVHIRGPSGVYLAFVKLVDDPPCAYNQVPYLQTSRQYISPGTTRLVATQLKLEVRYGRDCAKHQEAL